MATSPVASPIRLRDPVGLIALAQRQHGAVSCAQVREFGVSRFTQRGRIARGQWVRHLGVVVLGPSASGNAMQDAWAIALQLPAGGAVSGVTALELWRPGAARLHDLPRLAIAPHPTHPRIDGVRVLRLSHLRRESVRWHRGVPLRPLGEALMDLFSVLSAAAAQELLDRALQLHWIDARSLPTLARTRLLPGRRGARTVRRLLEQAADGTHSEAERRMATLLRKAGIRGWTANHKHRAASGRVVAELDFAWPRERVCLEVDGWAHHSGRRAFERDRARQSALTADGWWVLRATWTQITEEPAPLVGNIRAALARGALATGLGRNG